MSLSADDLRLVVRMLAPTLRTVADREYYLDMVFHDDAVFTAIPPEAPSPEIYAHRLVTTLERVGGRRLLDYLNYWVTETGGGSGLQVAPLLARLRSEAAPRTMAEDVAAHLDALIGAVARQVQRESVRLGGQIDRLADREAGLSAADLIAGAGARRRAGQYHPGGDGEPVPVEDVADRTRLVERGVLLGEPGAGKSWTLIQTATLHVGRWRAAEPGARVPILVPLRSFHGESQVDAGASADGIAWEPVTFETFVKAQAPALADHMDHLRHSGRLVFLLDALNEMPRQAPHTGRDLLPEILAFLRACDRYVVSCRVKEYEHELDPLRPLEQLRLLPLDPDQIQAAIDARFRASDGPGTARVAAELWRAMGGCEALLQFWAAVRERHEPDVFWQSDAPTPSYTPVDGDEAWHAMHDIGALPLCRTPLIVGLLCEDYEVTGALPRSRFALIDRVVDRGLASAAARAAGFGAPWPADCAAAIHSTLIAVVRTLQAIGATETGLDPAWPPDHLHGAADAGLVELGATSIRFHHQQFQDYFGAHVMYDAMLAGETPTRYFRAEEGWWSPGAWREPVAFLVDLAATRGNPEADRDRLAQWLCQLNPELAYDLLDVMDEHGHGPTPSEHMSPETRRAIIDAARARTTEPHPAGRASAYRVLGLLDADDRPGVDLDDDGLPDVRRAEAWCEVPAGPFLMGSRDDDPDASDREKPHHTVDLPGFWIAKYPVTYAQYRAFADAPGGYVNDDWWRERSQLQRPKGAGQPRWRIGNHPVESVDWCEAVAYGRWLSARLSEQAGRPVKVRLPSEAEWEKAARGPDGRVYPWGDVYEPGRANIDERWRDAGPYYMERTTAVGIYEQDNVFGAMDMCGNVWEWTSTDYETRPDADPSAKRLRVVRGGSWFSSRGSARAAARDGSRPAGRLGSLGFRLVVSSPIW